MASYNRYSKKYSNYGYGGNKRAAKQLFPYFLQNFQVKEAYKILRTNLQYFFINKPNKVIMISSANAGEGKTTTALNLALSLAEAGLKTIVVDIDLRRPSVHRQFEISAMPGVTNILGGLISYREAVRQTKYDNLDVLTAGAIPPNPAELLSLDSMRELLETLNGIYDYVIVDTPPVGIVTDAMVVGKHTAGVILVVREGSTTFEMLNHAKETLELLDVNIIGMILNEVAVGKSYSRRKGSKYNKYSYYGEYDTGEN